MNYWHLQMHPSNKGKFKRDKLLKILQEKEVIGMGESWTNQNRKEASDPSEFKNDLKIDDIVLIRDGSTPIALVKVTGNWFIEKNTNPNFDWFKLRRPIKLLKPYEDGDEKLASQILKKFNKSYFQAPGTLTFCGGNNATNQFIKLWHLKILKENIMNNIILNDQHRSNLKQLWDNFCDTYSKDDLKYLESSIIKLQDDWSFYREKIKKETLELDDYTNRLENSSKKGGYLCNFIERTTSEIYGSSKPGNAANFEIKLNDDNETYTFNENLKRGDGKINYNPKEDAVKRFNVSILPLLKEIVTKDSLIEKINIVEDNGYSAKQILRKIAVLDYPDDFINIYSDGVIDTLHSTFLVSETETNLGKNHEIRLAVNNILGIENTPVNAVLLSRFLWKYATSNTVADKNTPNVILYGPPGTGKTYTVKQSLDFVCMGDKSRYEFITFHPSFTYEDFIDGIKPKGVTNDGNIKFELTDGVFKKFCKKALQECIDAKKEGRDAKPYYFVVDEINRANLSGVFGETLMCLERDYRYNIQKPNENLYKTQYSPLIESMIEDAEKVGDVEKATKKITKETQKKPKSSELAFIYRDGNAFFGVPNNIFFIGMMNDVDKSIDTFDLALRRRFKWIRMDYDQTILEQNTKAQDINNSEFKNMPQYANACTQLNNYISDELGLGKSYEFGHSFFMKITDIAKSKTISKKNIETLFSLYLEPTLKEYLRAIFPEKELNENINKALELFKASI